MIACLKEKDSLENKVACIDEENKDLKNEIVSLMSNLNELCEGNTILKNKIVVREKQKEIVFQENISLKRKIVEKEKDFVSKKNKKNDPISHYALHATTSAVSYTHLRAHETPEHLVCRLLLEKKI